MTNEDMLKHLSSRRWAGHNVWLTEDAAVFPLWNFAGQLKGYQQYRPFADKLCNNPKEARYFTRTFEPCLWGLEYLPKAEVVFVTESIFKACSMHRCGFNAVACLGSNIPNQLRQQMLLTPFEWVAAGDNDEAGLKFSRSFRRGFVSQDLDELSDTQVKELAAPFLKN
jgi:hypothetical protein